MKCVGRTQRSHARSDVHFQGNHLTEATTCKFEQLGFRQPQNERSIGMCKMEAAEIYWLRTAMGISPNNTIDSLEAGFRSPSILVRESEGKCYLRPYWLLVRSFARKKQGRIASSPATADSQSASLPKACLCQSYAGCQELRTHRPTGHISPSESERTLVSLW